MHLVSRFHSYINTASSVIASYTGEEPFAGFLKKYFAQFKKYGSRDRKMIAHLCYCYFRLGRALPGTPVQQRILSALFLCSETEQQVLEELDPDLNKQVTLPVADKLALLKISVNDIFPWQEKLSEDIEKEKFITSHFTQPDLFIRIRPGNEKIVKSKLEKNAQHYRIISPSTIALPNSSQLDNIIELNREAVIQDLSSQQVGLLFEEVERESSNLSVWDCCAASGGKSIMAYDLLNDIDLTVSDIRKNIIVNLEKRFAVAGIRNYKSFIADLSQPAFHKADKFDLVIADVPCSGSGTWSRTPEQLHYFNQEKIEYYAQLQQKILANLFESVSADGYLLYITCSVFLKENEDAVKFITANPGWELVKKQTFKGYDKKADTLFAALFRKKL